jgi:voltage-gated potassium channel
MRGGDVDTEPVTVARSEALERWERATTWPLVALAVVFAATFVTELVEERPGEPLAAGVVRTVVWVLFLADYLVRVRLSGHATRYVLTHPLDLLVLAAPLLLPVLLVVTTLLRRSVSTRGRRYVVRRTLVYLVSVSTTLVIFIAAAVLLAERDRDGSNIRSLGDALWWSAVTVTSVGYGDLYPVSPVGRMLAVLGMLLGIGVLGTVTATISAQVLSAVNRVSEEEGEEGRVETVDLPRVLAEVQALRVELEAIRAATTAPPGRVDPLPAGPTGPPGPPGPPASPPGPPAG